MQLKLGRLAKLKKVKYSDYESIIKKEINQRLGKKTITDIFPFVLLSSDSLNWKCSVDNSKGKPMLYLNETTQGLIQDINQDSNIDLKKYAYGRCRLAVAGSKVKVYLSPQKGQLTNDTNLKPVQKVLKNFKPKLILEVVEDLSVFDNDTPLTTSNEAPKKKSEQLQKAPPNPQKLAKSIGSHLSKGHQDFLKCNELLNKVSPQNPKYNKIKAKRQNVVKELRQLCQEWKTSVLPLKDQLTLETTWLQLYAHYSKQLLPETTTTSNSPISEEQLYLHNKKQLETFIQAMNEGKTSNPVQIEKSLQTLQTKLDMWKKVAKGNSAYPKELQEHEQTLQQLQNNWEQEREMVIEFNKVLQQLKKAQATKAPEEIIQKLYQKAEALVNS